MGYPFLLWIVILVNRYYCNETFLTLESDLGLHQVIDAPTREDNILDLFFTNRPTLVNRSTVIPGISDHHAVYIDSHITMSRKKPVKRTIFMWGKADIQGIKEMCKELSNFVVHEFTSMSNINDVWSCFQGSHEHWKTWKITKKSSMHGKIMEFEKN